MYSVTFHHHLFQYNLETSGCGSLLFLHPSAETQSLQQVSLKLHTSNSQGKKVPQSEAHVSSSHSVPSVITLTAVKYLHLLQHTVEAGRLAGSRGSGDVEAAGETLQNRLLQERSNGCSLGFPGQEALGDSGVERLLHALKPRLWKTNHKVKGDAINRTEEKSILTVTTITVASWGQTYVCTELKATAFLLNQPKLKYSVEEIKMVIFSTF